MSDKQIEASTTKRRAAIYQKIAAVFDAMPERFTATELYQAAGLKANGPQNRMMIASVLTYDFKCISITSPGNRYRHWRKQRGQA